jgi:hypothetical protein
MPVLEVELTGGVTGPLREGLPGDYAENGTDALSAGVHPVFVRVLKRALPEGPLLVEEVQALTEAVAMATGRPSDQVHVAYEPSGAGRVSFGGRIVR